MSVTIEISDEKLQEAAEALNIRDPSRLFLSLLEEKLASHSKPPHPIGSGVAPGYEFPAPSKEEDDLREDFERRREWERASLPTAGTATLAELLAFAEALPELSEARFTAWEHELAHPDLMPD